MVATVGHDTLGQARGGAHASSRCNRAVNRCWDVVCQPRSGGCVVCDRPGLESVADPRQIMTGFSAQFDSSLGDTFSHVAGQVVYFLIETTEWLLGKSTSHQQTRAARQAANAYWKARALRRRGNTADAFNVAKGGYVILRSTDRDATFSETAMLVMLLDKLAIELGDPGAVRTELADALTVLQPIHADPTRGSRGLGQLLTWLEYRVKALND
jgi:hypothetical protein